MTENDIDRFSQILFACAEIFHANNISSQLDIFWALLKRFDFEAVEKAFHRHIEHGYKMPIPADILNNLKGGDPDSLAELSFPRMMYFLKHDYSWLRDAEAIFPDEAEIKAGLEIYKNVNIEEYKYSKAYFKEAYRKYFDKGLAVKPYILRGKRIEEETPVQKIIFQEFWPPELIDKHRAVLTAFKPDWPLLAASPFNAPKLEILPSPEPDPVQNPKNAAASKLIFSLAEAKRL
jgi:hypothetical protein